MIIGDILSDEHNKIDWTGVYSNGGAAYLLLEIYPASETEIWGLLNLRKTVLHGTIHGETISGEWYESEGALIGDGTFDMKYRQNKCILSYTLLNPEERKPSKGEYVYTTVEHIYPGKLNERINEALENRKINMPKN